MRERIEDGLVTVGGEAASDEENQPVSLNWRPNDHSSVAKSVEWHRLAQHSKHIQRLHLRALLADPERCGEMIVESDGVTLDYSRQQATSGTMQLLLDLAKRQKLTEKIAAMQRGEKINFTEKRAVQLVAHCP